MPVSTEMTTTRLQMVLIQGYDDEDKPVLRTRTYSNIKTDAENESIFNLVAELLHSAGSRAGKGGSR